uniref:NADH dehydrogenase subunit 6 n=1 Tax=Plectrocnemia sp. 1 YW-2021a TaxID=2823369 RepID=A0A8A9WFL0_9NEOP|nr:NADH dehydrogenase subunit 6 [Plectrocnemia sp. 1 YW-2021a]
MVILNIIMSNSLIFIFLKNPINMGTFIMIQTVISCLLMSNLMNYSWMAYINFLVIVGGLMIIFMYMCSLSWNLKIKIKVNIIFMLILIFFTLFYFFMLMKFMSFNKFIMFNNKINNINLLNNYKINMIKFFMKNSLSMMILMINMLVMILIIINKMNKNMIKPLRKMF